MKLLKTSLLVGSALFATAALAQEYPLGEPVTKGGMEIAGVYLAPITMDTEGDAHMAKMHLPASKSDVHLEADIHAAKGNPNGFAEGDWMPNLNVHYTVEKLDGGSKYKKSGDFMMMVASDGPHYGENIKLDGYGKYRVTYDIAPPKVTQMARHIDKETGVAPWFEPLTVSWEFEYKGTGRKGSY